MSPGACSTRHFKYLSSQLRPNLFHRDSSVHFSTKPPSQNKTVRYQRLPNIRINPIPSETPLSPADQFRLLQFLNRKRPDGHSSVVHTDVDSAGALDKRYTRRSSLMDGDPISSYLSVRLFPSSLRELSVDAYLLIAKEAQFRSLQSVMDLLAGDLLDHFPRESDAKGFSKVAVTILSLATPDCPLTPERTLALYNALTASDTTPPRLSPKAWDRVFSAALTHPEFRLFSLESFASSLLSEQSQTDQAYARYTWIAYRLLIQVLMEGQESFPQALRVFQTLVRSGRVPEVAQQLAENNGGSFKITIANVLVRGCLMLDWYIRAAELVMELLQDSRWSQAQGTSLEDVQATATLGLEVLHALVHSPTKQEVHMCRRLILALLSTSSTIPQVSPSPLPIEIPHADLHAFYEACHHYKFIGDAASVFVWLQSSRIRRHHHYPPPRHSALFWLFDHFADPGISSKAKEEHYTFKGYIRMARLILHDIIYHGIPVPVMDRPRFIAIAAARGFGFYARQLWELYTVESDPNRDVVRGNAQMLVPLVKLFRRLQEAWDTGIDRKRTLATNQTEQHMNVHPDHRESSIEPFSVTTQYQRVHMPGHDTKKSILPDARRFANRVLRSYIATKEPLAMASHEDLNALARAHLILDHIQEGLEALSIVMERGDIPDSKDVNVALGAISKYSPRRAADMLWRMVKNGVKPTPSAFSAVLHAALQDKDVRLVDFLINRAKKLGYGELTPKGIAALAHSIISFKHTTNEQERLRQWTNLGAVMETMETVMDVPSREKRNKDHGKDHILSIKMGHECIEAALMAGQPEVAFKFWRLLVKDRVLWEDRASHGTRALIGRCIRDRLRQGELHDEVANAMLDDLGEVDVHEHVD